MIEQRSAEWFEQRRGRLTGSNIGAALGINPWKTPDDLIRQMVREYHGAESEFQGNIATQHGTNHEPLALIDYEMTTGSTVQECGFFVHPEHDWLGASPDGLIGDDGLVEIKCPFGQRDKNPPEFNPLADQPHYFAQVQIEMACTGRSFCDFYQWSPNGDSLERVDYDPQWFTDNLPVLLAFYHQYINELDNPAHLEEKHKEINTQQAKILLDEYQDLCDAIDQATERKKEVFDEMVKLAKGRNSLVWGRKLTQVERKGAIDYKKVPQLKGVDLEPFRKKPSIYWRLS
jgi:putative phage-type endonuclease